jgi:peptidoglycan/LPS O-acetylase OafA/YrhL
VLDGIRALSVLWVLLDHTWTLYPESTDSFDSIFTMRWVQNGVYGVDSFFVLSGFMMYLNIKQKKNKNIRKKKEENNPCSGCSWTTPGLLPQKDRFV